MRSATGCLVSSRDCANLPLTTQTRSQTGTIDSSQAVCSTFAFTDMITVGVPLGNNERLESSSTMPCLDTIPSDDIRISSIASVNMRDLLWHCELYHALYYKSFDACRKRATRSMFLYRCTKVYPRRISYHYRNFSVRILSDSQSCYMAQTNDRATRQMNTNILHVHSV